METFVFTKVEELEPFIKDFQLTIRGHLTLTFDLSIDIDILVTGNIVARDIDARDIDAGDIKAWDIDVLDIKARDIVAGNIDAGNIKVAGNIDAGHIDARNIDYYAVCFARKSFTCASAAGRRDNSRHFCLDSEIVYK